MVAIQYRLRTLANEALDTGVLSATFHQQMRWWKALGIPAFASILLLFWLMVFKPLPLV